jgi:hypothetical protein
LWETEGKIEEDLKQPMQNLAMVRRSSKAIWAQENEENPRKSSPDYFISKANGGEKSYSSMH